MEVFEKLLKINDEINQLYEKEQHCYRVALLGNPNVGKSTLFNHLCKMHQHTGNWPGKTVALAKGKYYCKNRCYELVDLPGTYSLFAHSAEEEVARNYVCFHACDACVVVCDATCLERNLNLVLQALEITNKVVVVLNMMDEAKKKKIKIDIESLKKQLNISIVSMCARNKEDYEDLKQAIYREVHRSFKEQSFPFSYEEELEESLKRLSKNIVAPRHNRRFLALKLLDPSVDSAPFYAEIENKEEIKPLIVHEIQHLKQLHIYQNFEDHILTALNTHLMQLCTACIQTDTSMQKKDLRIDKFVCGKKSGIFLMLIILFGIFWITLSLANIPSAYLSEFFVNLEMQGHLLFSKWNVHPFLSGLLLDGILKTCGWVISVMLPPMAIFFPLFSLLEDIGYLPRIAFNLDGYFQRSHTCGKQALTMAMGFGCNAVGVATSRIIDSPRERLIAILTNVFMPCNGRFPALLSILAMFFTQTILPPLNTFLSAFLLTIFILFSIFLTFLVSYLLSKTILKGIPSSFTLELPPYRKPEISKVIVRSIFDRTIFVLGRAVKSAIPAGAIIWLLANIEFQDMTLLAHISSFLDPIGIFMGLDGVILLAFLLGFPANEIVIPIIIMSYMANGTMLDIQNLTFIKELFINNGWTITTALCTIVFIIFHFPCATTLQTIYKETLSLKWTCFAFILPTLIGMFLCTTIHGISILLSIMI